MSDGPPSRAMPDSVALSQKPPRGTGRLTRGTVTGDERATLPSLASAIYAARRLRGASVSTAAGRMDRRRPATRRIARSVDSLGLPAAERER